MKTWWVLAWDDYYPSGHLRNVHSTWETKAEADAEVARLRSNKPDYTTWYGADNIEVVNIEDML